MRNLILIYFFITLSSLLLISNSKAQEYEMRTTEKSTSKKTDEKKFIVIDGSMTELIRPSLYQAYHKISFIEPVLGETENFDIVGPVCESADYLGRNRKIPTPNEGIGIVILDAGAYGYAMSSNYNARNRPAEYMVDGAQLYQIRRGETIQDQLRLLNKEKVDNG